MGLNTEMKEMMTEEESVAKIKSSFVKMITEHTLSLYLYL